MNHRGAAGDAGSAVHQHLAALLEALFDELYARREVLDEHCRLHVVDWDGQVRPGGLWGLVGGLGND